MTTATITLTHTLPEQFLKDVLTTAVEGGLGYWAMATTPSVRDADLNVVQIELEPLEECAGDFEKTIVTLEKVGQGIQKVLTPEFKVRDDIRSSIFQAVTETDPGYIDTEGADIIVQAALFGEITYG